MRDLKTRISIVIVTWNARQFLEQCIRSIHEETKNIPFDLIVVDNASTDGSQEMLQSDFPDVKIIRNEKNLGFSRANNQAMRNILDAADSDFVLLLNVDTVIEDCAIERLVSHMEDNPELGAAGPALVLPNGKRQTGGAGYLPGVLTGFNYFFFLSRLFPRMAKPLFLNGSISTKRKKPVSVDWLSGACLMIRRNVIEKVGLMDESYFFYVEDIDWGRRMRREGIELHYLPWISVLHYHGGTQAKNTKGINTQWLVLLHRYLKKEKGWFQYLVFRCISTAGFLLRLFLYIPIWLWKRDDYNRQKIKEMFYFFFSALTGKEYFLSDISQ